MSIDRVNAKERIKSLIICAEKIRPVSLAPEARLMTLKWYDYRFMSPMAATMLFGDTYQKWFRRAIARTVDRNLAVNVRGIDLKNILSNPRQLTALWTARQHADELGIRYDEYLEFCFMFATNRRRKRLPQPNQLYFSEASEFAWIQQLMNFWPERLFGGLVKLEDLTQYRMEFYRGLPSQDGYRRFILDLASKHTKPWHEVMRIYSIEKQQLPIRLLAPAIGRERFRDALQRLKSDAPFRVAPSVNVTREQLWQSCFGIPHAFSADEEPCSICPQSAGCRKVAELVLADVKARLGSSDPVKQRENESGKFRTRKCRARKKREAAKIMAEPEVSISV